MDTASTIRSLILGGVVLLGCLAYSKVNYKRFRQYAGWPQPKPSLLWGHLNVLGAGQKKGPPGRRVDYIFEEIHDSLGKPPAFVLDVWPVSYPLLVVSSHEIAEQVTRTTKQHPWSMPKSPSMTDLADIVGADSIVTRDGEEWKALRRRFNPGFAWKHLLTLLPCILDKTELFLGHLDRFVASGDAFRLDELCVNLTFDIIGAVVMEMDLDAQMPREQQNEIIRLYRDLLLSYTRNSVPLPVFLRPIKTYRRRQLSRRLDVCIQEQIKRMFAEQKQQEASGSGSGSVSKSRSVLSLSLKGMDRLDRTVLQSTCDQLRTFLLAGHDTTSSTLQWAFYELSRTPRALAAIRRELDEVFGADPDPKVVRAKLLAEGGGELLSRLPYTSAVIKETLRLYPPAGTARMIRPWDPVTGVTVRLPGGAESPLLDTLVLYLCHYLIQRDPAVYGETANVFVPERWLGNNDTSMATNESEDEREKQQDGKAVGSSIPASAWRPFERGPRNCIGQELANVESRVILACVVRRYDFQKVGLGAAVMDEQKGCLEVDAHGQYKVREEVFNTQQITGKPADGMRMKIKLSEQALSALG